MPKLLPLHSRQIHPVCEVITGGRGHGDVEFSSSMLPLKSLLCWRELQQALHNLEDSRLW